MHWSALFWVNVPLSLIVIAAIVVLFKGDAPAKPRQIDFIGASLLIGGTTSSVMALNAATGEHGSMGLHCNGCCRRC